MNRIIVGLCIKAFVINSSVADKNSLYEISDNITVAYLLNFLAGCQDILGQWGSMSFENAFSEGQIWRCVTHIYLH